MGRSTAKEVGTGSGVRRAFATWHRAWLAVPLALFAGCSTAEAATACAEKPAIIALATSALDNRAAIPKLAGRRIGVISAYLLMAYGSLDGPAADARVADLVAAGARRSDDLAAALAASRGGAAAIDLKAIASSNAYTSTQRILVRSKDRKVLLEAIAGLGDKSSPDIQSALAVALVDLTDAEKAAIAADAEASKLLVLAAGLVAGMKDAKAWQAFASRLPPEEVTKLVNKWYWLPGLNGNPDLARTGLASGVTVALQRSSISLAIRLDLALGEAGFVSAYLNQTGDFGSVAAISSGLQARFEKGEPAPLRDPAAGWLATYKALIAAKGNRTDVDRGLYGITLRIQRHYGNELNTALRWAAAAEVFGPPLARGDAPPASPTDDFAGPGEPSFEALAQLSASLLKADGIDRSASDPRTAGAAAELLFAARRGDDLVKLVAAMSDKGAAATIAEDFAARLDRLCEGHLATRGEAILFTGEPLFKFE